MLDAKTVLFSYFVTNTLITIFMALLWYRNRKRYAGLFLWLMDFILQALGLVLFLLRGIAPLFLSVVIGNTLSIFGIILLLMGLERFVGRPRWQIHNYLLLTGFVLSLSYFLFLRPDISIRTILGSVAIGLLTGQCAWLMLGRVAGTLKPIARPVGVVFVLFALVALVRVVTLLLLPLPAAGKLFQSPQLQVLFLVSYQMLAIALTFALILLVSRRLQSDLQLQETRQQAFLKNFQGIAYQMTGAEVPPLMFAGQVRELTGYEPDDFLQGRVAWEQMIHPDELPALRAQYEKALKDPGLPVRAEYRFRRLDGSWRWMGEVGERLPLDYRTPVYQGAIQDITDRKRDEQVLKESEEKFALAFRSSPYGITITRAADGRIIDVNEGFSRITGYPISESLGKTTLELGLWADDRDRVAVVEDLSKGHPVSGRELRFRKRNGEIVTGLFAAQRMQVNQEACILSSIGDITDRKRAEEALLLNEQQLQEKNAELTRFTRAVSHDLKSPLVTIRTFLGYLEKDGLKQDPAEVNRDLAYMRTAADKMARLLDELAELSLIGNKKNPFEEAPLKEIIQEALDLAAGRISQRGVQVRVTEGLVLVYGERRRLVEVFQNLVDNAVKFMGDQTDPRVEIGAESLDDEMVFFVRDNGIGIDPRHQPKVFGLFEKLDPHQEGTGLGLALVRRIVEAHGGRIWVESEGVGKGACFRFTLGKNGGRGT